MAKPIKSIFGSIWVLKLVCPIGEKSSQRNNLKWTREREESQEVIWSSLSHTSLNPPSEEEARGTLTGFSIQIFSKISTVLKYSQIFQ